MKTKTYFDPRFKRMRPVYPSTKSVFASGYRTKGDSKVSRRHANLKSKDEK